MPTLTATTLPTGHEVERILGTDPESNPAYVLARATGAYMVRAEALTGGDMVPTKSSYPVRAVHHDHEGAHCHWRGTAATFERGTTVGVRAGEHRDVVAVGDRAEMAPIPPDSTCDTCGGEFAIGDSWAWRRQAGRVVGTCRACCYDAAF